MFGDSRSFCQEAVAVGDIPLDGFLGERRAEPVGGSPGCGCPDDAAATRGGTTWLATSGTMRLTSSCPFAPEPACSTPSWDGETFDVRLADGDRLTARGVVVVTAYDGCAACSHHH